MHNVVIDTNVFISGLLFGGNPAKLLEAWSQKNFILCISPELQAEIINKLEIKFKVPKQFTDSLLLDLSQHTMQFIPQKKISILRDPKDNFLLELAQEAKADYLISGDKDVLVLQKYKNTKIVTPKEFLEILK